MIQSFGVVTTLAAYRCVSAHSVAHKVVYPPAANSFILGITKDTVKDTTGMIPVATVGERALLHMNETMASGGLVGSDTSGRGTPYTVAPDTTTSLTVTTAYVGVLIGAAVALTGTLAEVYICPGLAKGTKAS